jgi:hypothetical protein
MKYKKWTLAAPLPGAETIEAGGISPLLARVLAQKGCTTAKEARQVLSRGPELLHSPELMKDMTKAVDRIIAAIVPLAVVAYFFLTKRETTDTTPEVVMRLFSVVIPMIALYFHVKHLIIKDVEGGLIKNLRFYNLLGVLNCLAFFVGLFTMPMSVPWYIAFIIYDIVTIAILPALRSGLKKLNI